VSKVIWQKAASPFCHPRGDECIRPPSALYRHIRYGRQANNAECAHAYRYTLQITMGSTHAYRYITMGRYTSPQKWLFP